MDWCGVYRFGVSCMGFLGFLLVGFVVGDYAVDCYYGFVCYYDCCSVIMMLVGLQ